MKFLNSHWVASALGFKPAGTSQPISNITSDSRAVKPGSLFVALKGENADGHGFVEAALRAGAVAVVHKRDFSLTEPALSFSVEDTLGAWRLLAKAWRNEFQIPLVAVAGSAGKTTSKELLAAVLSGKFKKILKTQGSQNGFQGIPSTLLGLREEHEAAVIEVGIDEIGAMEQHLEIVNPMAGLLSSIGPEHLEKLIDLETVEREEGFLFKWLSATGKKNRRAINADDPAILRQAKLYPGAESLTYSLRGQGDLNGEMKVVNGQWQLFIPSWNTTFPCPLPGEHNGQNLLGALALAKLFQLSPEEMQAGLATFTPPPGRGEIHQWKGATVFLDAYNANPASVEAALKTARSLSQGGALWVCLGDMLELGRDEWQLHAELASPLIESGAAVTLLYGKRMGALREDLVKRRYSGSIFHEESHESLARRIAADLKPGDIILIKGSRGMRMETVWSALQQIS